MMLVRKTPNRDNHLSALARTNDLLCFFLFYDAELIQKLLNASADYKEKFTPEVFPNNPYGKRINVTMPELLDFRSKQLDQALSMSFVSAVEQLLLYIKKAILYCCEINQLDIQITEPIEDCLENFYKSIGGDSIPTDFLKTIKYLRLRRNHCIHIADRISAELEKLLKSNAKGMNKYWSSLTSITGVNFESRKVTSFTADESITLIKIIRICIENIDKWINEYINAKSLIAGLHSKLLEVNTNLREDTTKNLEKRIRKVRKLARDLYGIAGTEAEIKFALGITI